MDRIGIYGFYHIAYCLALALYQIKFEKIWYHEIVSTIQS